MLRLFCILTALALATADAYAEYIYKDNAGRTLRMYYSWAADSSGFTKLNVQFVNYSSVTWVDIVLNCEVMTGFGGARAAKKEIPLASPVMDFELSKEIAGIDIGQIQPNAKLNCMIVKASHGERTLRPER